MNYLKKQTNDAVKSYYNTYFNSVTSVYENQVKLRKQNWLPDINIDYFKGKNSGLTKSLSGFQVGLAVPILFSGTVSKTKVAQLELQSWEQKKQSEERKMDTYMSQKNDELLKYQEAVNYYNQYGKKLSEEILKVANRSYKQGEIDFFQYIQSLENATAIQIENLDTVLQYNIIQLDLQYLNF